MQGETKGEDRRKDGGGGGEKVERRRRTSAGKKNKPWTSSVGKGARLGRHFYVNGGGNVAMVNNARRFSYLPSSYRTTRNRACSIQREIRSATRKMCQQKMFQRGVLRSDTRDQLSFVLPVNYSQCLGQGQRRERFPVRVSEMVVANARLHWHVSREF